MPVRLTSRIPKIIADARLRREVAVKAAAEQIEANAKGMVPVDEGDLKASIKAEKHGDEYRVGAGSRGAFHAHFVEFGTTKMAARPYLVPAAERARQSLVQYMKRVVR